ncbi:hypothetical protein [Phenylobacterium sp.]|uniref:hypothetical protein n=1 Tax=Phenylobacterium sp. TaxID=1871053 RepID=UPI002ED8A4B1
MTTMMSLGRRTFLGMAVGSIALAGEARTEPYDLVDLTVVDRDTGQPLRVWRHDGRMYVAGRPGARYSLRVTNNTGGRVLAVMAVDGVNVLTGESAAFAQMGYVFGAYQSYDVSGWRKSDTEVAAFTFTAQRNSYAARTGRPFDVGVIGIAVFRERLYRPPPPPPPAAMAAPRAQDRAGSEVEELVVTEGSRRAAPPPPALRRREEKLGTGHGEREWSAVTEVDFERATRHPQLIRRIEYDTYDNLVAAGVIPRPPYPDRRPRPFPSEGYVPDPPGWR